MGTYSGKRKKEKGRKDGRIEKKEKRKIDRCK